MIYSSPLPFTLVYVDMHPLTRLNIFHLNQGACFPLIQRVDYFIPQMELMVKPPAKPFTGTEHPNRNVDTYPVFVGACITDPYMKPFRLATRFLPGFQRLQIFFWLRRFL